MAMDKIEAYKCSHCGDIFKTATHHGPCKNDPNVQHCGECVHHGIPPAVVRSFDYGEDEWEWSRHTCAMRHDNHIPRKLNCPDYCHYAEPFKTNDGLLAIDWNP